MFEIWIYMLIKKIKITKNALTGEELLTFTNKHSNKNNGFNLGKKKNFFYSTNSSQKDDKYLSYITPIKSKKPNKIIYILNKNSFSVMDI
jgi:hypothetical protein